MQSVCTYTTLIIATIITQWTMTTMTSHTDDGCLVSHTITEICDEAEYTSMYAIANMETATSNCGMIHPTFKGDLSAEPLSQLTYELSSEYNQSHTYTWSVIGPAKIISGQGSQSIQMAIENYTGENIILRVTEQSESGSCKVISAAVIEVNGSFAIA